MRVLGIDPGTVSFDLCGIEDGRVFLDTAVPTREALAEPNAFVDRIAGYGPLDCVVGPSGYGLPLTRGADLTDADVRLAILASPGESGGIGGLGAVLRALGGSSLPVIFTPGVVHLSTVPAYRKINRIDLGTADKVCATALAIREQTSRRRCSLGDTSFILLELGGAFTAGVAVAGGQIIDGIGGSSGPFGARASGALDGEVAFLAGRVSKAMIFGGGAATVGGESPRDPEAIARPTTALGQLAWDAFVEGAIKAVAALHVSLPHPAEIVLSGRLARSPAVYDVMAGRLGAIAPVHRLQGFGRVAKQAAQGAALLADGLAGGIHGPLVDALALRQSSGTVLDWLYVITPEQARESLGRIRG